MARRSAFRRAVTMLVMVPLTLILVVFVVSNRAEVMLSLWPLSDGVAAPLYLLVLALFLMGALIGSVIAWLSGAKTRRALRQAGAEAERAEREARELSGRVTVLERALAEKNAGDEAQRRSLAISE